MSKIAKERSKIKDIRKTHITANLKHKLAFATCCTEKVSHSSPEEGMVRLRSLGGVFGLGPSLPVEIVEFLLGNDLMNTILDALHMNK